MKIVIDVVAWCMVVSSAMRSPGDEVAAPKPHPAAEAARALLARLLPEQVERFAFESIPADKGRDVFEVESRAGKVLIRGNNPVAMATGLNWYLKHYCHADVSWCGSQLTLPATLPEVKPKIRRASSFCSVESRPWSIIVTICERERCVASGSHSTVTCVARYPCFRTSRAARRQSGSPKEPTARFSSARSTPASTSAPSVMSPLMPLAQSR